MVSPARSNAGPIETNDDRLARPVLPIEINGQLSPTLQQALDKLSAGSYADAVALAKQAIGDHPTQDAAAAYEIQGIGLFLQGESDAALVALKRSVELDPQRSSAFTKLGSIELDIGDVGEARKDLERALALNGDDKFAHQRLGAVLERQGDRAGAIREYGLAIAGKPSQAVTAKVDLGRLYNLDGRFADTIALLEPGVTPQSSDPAALLVLGTAYLGIGNTAKALPLMRSTQTRFPNDPGATLSVGIAERAAGQFDASVSDLKHAIDLKKDWSTAYYQLGLTYLAQSKYVEAQTAIEKAQSLDPGALSVQEGLGQTLLLGGKPDQAIAVFRTLSERGNARLDDLVALATAYQAAGRADDAERTYRDGIQRFPKNPTAYLRLGAALAMRRNYDEALKVMEQGDALDPRNPRLLRDMAFVQGRLNRYSDAIATGQSLVALDPQNPDGLFLLATLYQDSGDATRAISTYQQVLKIKPDHAIALNNLAVLLTSDNKAPAAVLLARRAVALIPKNSALQDTLGWALLKSGQAPEAVAVLAKAHELAPDDPQQLYRLAVAQDEAGNRDAARQNLQAALAMPAGFRDVEQARTLLGSLAK
jgi:tetratricopeptide (TPR) repeat protein